MPVLAPRGLHPRCPRRRAASWVQVQVRVEQSPSCRLQHTHPPLPTPHLPWLGKAPESSSLVWEGGRWGAERGQSADAGGIPALSVEPELRGWQMGETSAIMKGIPSRWPEAELRGCGIGVILPIHPLLGDKASWGAPRPATAAALSCLASKARQAWAGGGGQGTLNETGREGGQGEGERDKKPREGSRSALSPTHVSWPLHLPTTKRKMADHVGVSEGFSPTSPAGSWRCLPESFFPVLTTSSLSSLQPACPVAQRELSNSYQQK